MGPGRYPQYTRAHYGGEGVGSSKHHTSPIFPTPPRMVAEQQWSVPRARSPRASHQQSGGQSSRATCCPFLPVVQTIHKIVEIPQEQFFLEKAVDMLIMMQRRVPKNPRVQMTARVLQVILFKPEHRRDSTDAVQRRGRGCASCVADERSVRDEQQAVAQFSDEHSRDRQQDLIL